MWNVGFPFSQKKLKQEMWFLLVAALAIFFSLIAIFIYYNKVFNYWKRRGVPYVRPTSLIFGNIRDIFYEKKNVGILYQEIYRKFPNSPYIGFFEFHKPILLLKDPRLIKSVLVKNFNSFNVKKASLSNENDPFFGLNPAVLKGSRWKEIRTAMIPAFTYCKLSSLSKIIFESYTQMSKYIEKYNSCDIDVFDFSSRFTSNTVSSYGWGAEGHGFSEEEPLMKAMFDRLSSAMNLYYMKMLLHPLLANWYNVMHIPKSLLAFFTCMTIQSMSTLNGASHGGTSIVSSVLQHDKQINGSVPTENADSIVLRHLLTFFVDAYETTAWGFNSAFYYLTSHPEVQNKLREEIRNNIRADKERINHKDFKNLKYLDMFISEVLRIYPPFPYLDRVCTTRCQIGKLVIEPGTTVIVPTYAIHHDAEHYPDPEAFDPENFNQEKTNRRHPYSYLPFGQGPRMCSGMKFSLFEMKLLLCYLLRDYELIQPKGHQLQANTPSCDSTLLLIPEKKIYMRFKKLVL